MSIDDSNTLNDLLWTLTSNRITSDNPFDLVFEDAEALLLSLGAGDDQIKIDSTITGQTTLDAGDGNDDIRIKAIDGETSVTG